MGTRKRFPAQVISSNTDITPFLTPFSNMGIKGLSQLIADKAPGSIRENEFENYFGSYVPLLLSGLIMRPAQVASVACSPFLTKPAQLFLRAWWVAHRPESGYRRVDVPLPVPRGSAI
jgi:hypothetical protein